MSARSQPSSRKSVLGDRLEKFGVTSYDEYLRSSRWTARKEKYHTDGGPRECFVCGSSQRIHIHHRSYRNLGHEKHNDLVTLCEGCHHGVHEYMKTHRGPVVLANAHIRFKQSREAKQAPAPFIPAGTGKLRRGRRKKTKFFNGIREQQRQQAEAKTKRAIKAREDGHAEHEVFKSRRKNQQKIREARENLGRPLTRREAAAIINST